MNSKARALYFTSPGEIAIRKEVIRPRRGQLLVQSRLIGISQGTEMLLYRGEFLEDMKADDLLPSLADGLRYPLKYGYINTGTTEGGRRVFAFYPHQDLFFMHSEQCIELPEDLSFEDAANNTTRATWHRSDMC